MFDESLLLGDEVKLLLLEQSSSSSFESSSDWLLSADSFESLSRSLSLILLFRTAVVIRLVSLKLVPSSKEQANLFSFYFLLLLSLDELLFSSEGRLVELVAGDYIYSFVQSSELSF